MKRAGASRGARHSAGVALIEVLVSLLLFSLGILGMIGLQARAMTLTTDAENRNRAALLANELGSAMWLHNSVTVDADTLAKWKTRVGDSISGLPSGTGEATVDAANNRADITITWSPPAYGAEAQSRLTTRVTLPQ